MPAVSSSILGEANLLNLKSMKLSDVRKEVPGLMMNDEQIIQAFTTVRDQVIFTDQRIWMLTVN